MACFALVAVLTAGCRSPKTFDSASHRVTMMAAAAERPTPPSTRRRSAAALRHAQHAAFHRFIVSYWLHRWLEGLAATDETARYACGGDLPDCWIVQRESKFNPYAVNPGHAGAPYGDPGDPWTHASGKFQFMPSTWNNYAGYPYAAAAPASVQNAKAREVWAGGAGAGAWACC